VLLVNPSSGGGRALKRLPRIEAVLDSRRVPFRVVRTRSLDDGVAKALRAVEAGELPVVVSGDGMVGAIGGAMAGAETPLGIVPVGRGNDLARVLGIPTDIEAAIEVVLAGNERAIDVGEANGRPFLGIASVGFDSDANRIANEARFVRGNLVYLYAALRTMAGWRSARFTIAIGEERSRLEGYDVVVANNSCYGGGMYIAPDAELDDGKFDIVTIADMGKLRALYNLTKVFKGTHVRIPEVDVVRASRLQLSASRPFAVYADGEHLTDLPADLRVIPRALRVLVPPAA
jgi:YegS/Rv2252/BmrU family lipid kinase